MAADAKLEVVLSAKDMATKTIQGAAHAIKTSLTSLTQNILSVQGALVGLVGGYGLKSLADSMWNVGVSSDRIARSLAAATGSIQEATAAQVFLKEESERLGLVFEDQVNSYKNLAAAARGTALEGQATKDIYIAVAEAATALQMSTYEAEGALTAIGQMLSKGKVQAEELRGQLGERLPGAFQIAAKAMGVTTAQLSKMLEEGKVLADDFLPRFAQTLRSQFAGQVANAADSAQASVNRLKNTWYDLQKTVMESGVLDEVKNTLVNINTQLSNWITQNRALIQQRVPEFIQQITDGLQRIWTIISYDPAIVEYGLIGLAVGGKKGAVLIGGMAHMAEVVRTQAAAFALVASGQLKISQVATANFKELQALVNQFDAGPIRHQLEQTVVDLEDKVQQLRERMYGGQLSSVLPAPDYLRKELANYERALEEAKAKLQDYDISGALQSAMEAESNAISNALKKVASSVKPFTLPPITVTASQDLREYNAFLREVDRLQIEAANSLKVLETQSTSTWQSMNEWIQKNNNAEREAIALAKQWSEEAIRSISPDMPNMAERLEEALGDPDAYFGKITDSAESMAESVKNAVTGWASGFSKTLSDLVWGAETSFSDIAESFGRMLTQMVMQQMVVQPLLNAFTGWMGAAFPSAQGNVFVAGAPQPYAKGGIIDRPTLFPMASGGMGLAGEAGDEAIFPITRLPGGDLGIKGSGAAPPNVTVVVTNNTGQAAQARQDAPKWNGQEWVIGVWLDAYERNVGGLRNMMGR